MTHHATRRSALRTAQLASAAFLLAMGLVHQARADETGIAETTGPSLTRAEVTADLNLWRRAGADSLAELATYGLQAEEFEQAVTRYRALRSGVEFARELEKIKGVQAVAQAAP